MATAPSSRVALSPCTEEETVVDTRMDPLSWLRKQLEEADIDLLREMVCAFAEDPHVGAPGRDSR